jgi:regulator of replication initiation timing
MSLDNAVSTNQSGVQTEPVNNSPRPRLLSTSSTSSVQTPSSPTTSDISRVRALEFKLAAAEGKLHQAIGEKDSYAHKLKESVDLRADLENNLSTLQVEFDTFKQTVAQAVSPNDQLQLDMERLAEKLIDEAEKRSELEHAKQCIENELEDLSKNLFEEANKMVEEERRINHEWSVKYSQLEKRYNDVKVLLTSEKEQSRELKERLGELIVEREAHESITPPYSHSRKHSNSGSVSTSTTNLNRSSVSYDSGYKDGQSRPNNGEIFSSRSSTLCFNIEDHRFEEFKEYLEAPSSKGLYLSSKFMKRALSEEVDSALRFESSKVVGWLNQKRILTACQNGTLTVFSFTQKNKDGLSPSPVNHNRTKSDSSSWASLAGRAISSPNPYQQCSFCNSEDEKKLTYQYLLGESDQETKLLCYQCRDRLITVCDFFSFLRMVRNGVLKGTPQKLYLDSLHSKHKMFLARVGADLVTEGVEDVPDNVSEHSPSSRVSTDSEIMTNTPQPESTNNLNLSNIEGKDYEATTVSPAPDTTTFNSIIVTPAENSEFSETPLPLTSEPASV